MARDVERRLAAIFSADVAGYSRLMAQDELATLETLHAYRDAMGLPADARLISCFLDADDRELIVDGLEALRQVHQAGDFEMTAGLRTQLRMLAEDPDDEVAERAEELIELL